MLINNIEQQPHVQRVDYRSIEFYPTDRYIWTQKTVFRTDFYLLENLNVTTNASRMLVHIFATRKSYLSSFSINVTTYREPDPLTGSCAIVTNHGAQLHCRLECFCERDHWQFLTNVYNRKKFQWRIGRKLFTNVFRQLSISPS